VNANKEDLDALTNDVIGDSEDKSRIELTDCEISKEREVFQKHCNFTTRNSINTTQACIDDGEKSAMHNLIKNLKKGPMQDPF